MKCTLAFLPMWDPRTPPLSLAYLKASLQENGIECRVFDFAARRRNVKPSPFGDTAAEKAVFNSTKLDEWADQIVATNPDVIGFSLLESNQVLTQALAEVLKKRLPGIPMIVGGPAVVPELKKCITTSLQYAKYAVQGDAETILPEIIKSIDKHEKIVSMKQIWFLDNKNEAKYTGSAPNVNLNKIPYPDYDDFDLSLYRYPGEFPIMFSRGCILNCSFCTNKWNDKTQRGRTAESVHGELVYIVEKYGAKQYIFNDDSLISMVTLKEIEKFCDMAIASGHVLPWSVFGTRIERHLTLPYVQKLARAGLAEVMLGVESFSSDVQKHMGKSANFELTDKVIRMFAEAGVKPRIYLMYGYPSETDENFEETLNWLNSYGHILSYVSVQPFFLNSRFTDTRPGVAVRYFLRPWGWYSEASTLQKRKERFLRLVEVLEQVRSRKGSFQFRIADPFAIQYFEDWNPQKKAKLLHQWQPLDEINRMVLRKNPMAKKANLGLNKAHSDWELAKN